MLTSAEGLLARASRPAGRGRRGVREGEAGRAVRLALRSRVPCPSRASREGPLSRLAPREREVLDLLATGTTNKTVATTLFVTEKTASVHVSGSNEAQPW